MWDIILKTQNFWCSIHFTLLSWSDLIGTEKSDKDLNEAENNLCSMKKMRIYSLEKQINGIKNGDAIKQEQDAL